LIVVLSVTMLYSLLMSAASITRRTKVLSAAYADEQNAAQQQTGSASGTVTVSGADTPDSGAEVPVIYTGSGDQLTSYVVAASSQTGG
jgi:hypothetical protein